MKILVLNVGSTTLKFACVEMPSGNRLTQGIIDRIGQPGGDAVDHLSAANEALNRHSELGIDAIGHRIVQGGDRFSTPTLVNADVLIELKKLDELAPLHNPPARSVVQVIADGGWASTPQVLVFDTAYFATLPPAAYRYAIPESIYRQFAVRRYGAHGTSHRYVTNKALAYLESRAASSASGAQPPHSIPLPQSNSGEGAKPNRIISLHLGGGASATASIGGVAVETSMGMTPLEGLVMASRSGDLDPSIPLHLVRHAGMSVDDVDKLLNKQSGLVGLCGEPDMRAILKRRSAGDQAAGLAIEVYVHRLLKTIGGYIAVLGGLEALVFTAGVGENAAAIRELVTVPLAHFGIVIDQQLNASARSAGEIIDLTSPVATVRSLIVPTDEEHAIAEQTAEVLRK